MFRLLWSILLFGSRRVLAYKGHPAGELSDPYSSNCWMLLRLGDIVRNGNRHLPEYGTFLLRIHYSDRLTDSFELQSVLYRSFWAAHKFRLYNKGRVLCTSSRPAMEGNLSMLHYSVFVYSGCRKDSNHNLWRIWGCWRAKFQTRWLLLLDYRFSDNR
mgnify:CR=1 FL=1